MVPSQYENRLPYVRKKDITNLIVKSHSIVLQENILLIRIILSVDFCLHPAIRHADRADYMVEITYP